MHRAVVGAQRGKQSVLRGWRQEQAAKKAFQRREGGGGEGIGRDMRPGGGKLVWEQVGHSVLIQKRPAGIIWYRFSQARLRV